MKTPTFSFPIALIAAFAISPATVAVPLAEAQTYNVLYSFQGSPADGRNPQGGLLLDQLGNLYGTTWSGGSDACCGIIFELDPTSVERVLHTFSQTGTDGTHPAGDLVRVGSTLYGTTYFGGGSTACSSSCGTVFQLSRGIETVAHDFGASEGAYPSAGLIRDPAGNLYGTTLSGSGGSIPSACGSQGCGTVFGIIKGQESVLYTFRGQPDGVNPGGTLVLDKAGNLYGTTAGGGQFNAGTVFELSRQSNGKWTEKTLYNFRGMSDGAGPLGSLLIDDKGNLYGITQRGGLKPKNVPACSSGCGAVFKLSPDTQGTWVESVLHSFSWSNGDGAFPMGRIVRDTAGTIYGITNSGGASSMGIVYSIDVNKQETILHTFTGGTADGAAPVGGLLMDAAGNLFGTSSAGGSANCGGAGCGTVFKISF